MHASLSFYYFLPPPLSLLPWPRRAIERLFLPRSVGAAPKRVFFFASPDTPFLRPPLRLFDLLPFLTFPPHVTGFFRMHRA